MRKALALALTAGLLTAPASAGAVIVPQKSIAGVKLQMTEQQVIAALGEPRSKKRRKDIFGTATTWTYPGLSVVFRTGEQQKLVVLAVNLTGTAERTAAGIGVGSTWQQVKRGVPRVKCERIVHVLTCHVGDFLAGRTVTDFQLSGRRVSRVTLGIVID